jgi:hypothetical protein
MIALMMEAVLAFETSVSSARLHGAVIFMIVALSWILCMASPGREIT